MQYGSSNEYAPSVKINDMYAAQLMFVIGTDGGGLEHPNWLQNLKIAVKIQEKANEMYPGLFRSIIVRNSRYNQHVATRSINNRSGGNWKYNGAMHIKHAMFGKCIRRSMQINGSYRIMSLE